MPPNLHLALIRIDYRDRREMFFAEAPPFAIVMADLRELEDRVNRQTRWGFPTSSVIGAARCLSLLELIESNEHPLILPPD